MQRYKSLIDNFISVQRKTDGKLTELHIRKSKEDGRWFAVDFTDGYTYTSATRYITLDGVKKLIRDFKALK